MFLRFSGCNLRCRCCDTRFAHDAPRTFFFYDAEGTGHSIRNPIDAGQFAEYFQRFAEPVRLCPEVSLTGGEPLLAVSFIEKLLPTIVAGGRRTMLETNGTLPEELGRVIDAIDCVAMDIKIPSTSGQPLDAQRAKAFLGIARQREVFVKIVIGPGTDVAELDEAAGVISSVDPEIPLVLQPLTRRDGSVAFDERAARQQVLFLSERLLDVRVIAQMHRFLRVK